MVQQVRNIAPFINDVFTITSPWWNERINPITGEVEIHRGLDIATSLSKPVYSMLDGIVTASVHSESSLSVSPVLSLPKTKATFPPGFSFEPEISSASEANSSGRKSFPLRYFPRRLVVPNDKTQSSAASVMELKNSAFS